LSLRDLGFGCDDAVRFPNGQTAPTSGTQMIHGAQSPGTAISYSGASGSRPPVSHCV